MTLLERIRHAAQISVRPSGSVPGAASGIRRRLRSPRQRAGPVRRRGRAARQPAEHAGSQGRDADRAEGAPWREGGRDLHPGDADDGVDRAASRVGAERPTRAADANHVTEAAADEHYAGEVPGD